MQNKVTIFVYILSISAVIDSLQSQGQPPLNWHRRLYDNNTSRTRLMEIMDLSMGISDFLDQNQCFQNQNIPDMTPQHGDTFDFVVIGAGTAGATIAARLSEIPQIKILLIEAGSHENLFMDIPVTAPDLSQDNNINWVYQTKPSNKYCLGVKDNSCIWAAGKVVGGTSVINGMVATRGGTEDYDRWAEMGNEGWAYKDVLKYFQKLETMDIPELRSDVVYHNIDGPVHITYPPFHTSLAEAFLEAGKELGYPLVDYNGKNEIGFSYVQSTILNGTRMSSNRAYLHPVRDRNNLHMTLRSMVTKVLIDPSTKRAIGVEFVKNNQTIRVFANKEVILCAGAIGSPKLLMLSGIGPTKHLTKLGIDVIQDAPVGQNLMDHLIFFGLTWTVNESISSQTYEQLNPLHPYTEFFINRTGPLTFPAVEALGFINTKHPENRSGLPDIELLMDGDIFKEGFALRNMLNLKKPIRQEWGKYVGSDGWSVAAILLKPKSRGRITLLANDINVKPEIVPNYFDDSDDMRTMIAGIRTAKRLSQTKKMQALDSQLLNITYMECNNCEYDSDVYWECVIRIMSSTIFHYCGTCKMGAKGDPTAVVDPRLKVISIQGLRVSDASIMPEIISAHLSIPIYMIAEKTADMIKEEWGLVEYLKKS